MRYEIYSDYVASGDLSVFEFISVGMKGTINKRVAFIPTERQGVYKLAFGDVDENDELMTIRLQIMATGTKY